MGNPKLGNGLTVSTALLLLICTLLLSLFLGSPIPVVAQTSYPPPPTPTPIGMGGASLYINVYLPLISHQITPPHFSQSYYIWSLTGLNGLGCDEGHLVDGTIENHDFFVFLSFGKPNRNSEGILGTVTYNLTPVTEDQIEAAVIDFAEGFYSCNAHAQLKIAVGTNTSGTYTYLIAYDHGAMWAQMVVDINNQLAVLGQTEYYSGIDLAIEAVTGINIEPGFNPVNVPDDWLKGYNEADVPGKEPSYVIGSADQCPLNYPPDNASYPGFEGNYPPEHCLWDDNLQIYWTQQDLYQMNWGYGSSWPFPEIYETGGAHAEQWHHLAIYANVNNNSMMGYYGTMTQFYACVQRRAQDPTYTKCDTLDNYPDFGFIQLYNEINGDDRVLNSLHWSTDMKYSGGY